MRNFVAVLTGLLACVLLPLSLISLWADQHVVSTAGYVAATAPLADDPEVQRVVTDMVAGSLPNYGQEATDQQIRAVVTGPQFGAIWRAANRSAHTQLIAALEDPDASVVTIRIDLGAVAEGLSGSLEDPQLTMPTPVVEVELITLSGTPLRLTRTAYGALAGSYPWLPIAWLLLVLATLALAPRRRLLALALLGAGSAAATVVLLAVLSASREAAVRIVGTRLDVGLVAAGWDAATEPLRTAGLVAAVMAAVIAVVGGIAAVVAQRRTRAGDRSAEPERGLPWWPDE